MHDNKSTMRGYTLTELAVVLAIVALLVGGLMMPLSSQRSVEQARSTTQSLHDIRDALTGFALIYGRLPCPDTDTDPAQPGYGMEEAACSGDLASEGYLPWRTLGVSEHDAWGEAWLDAGSPRRGHWRYRVERGYANATALKNQILSPNAATAFADEQITIVNTAGQALNHESERPIAVLYSAGPNLQPDGHNASFEANKDALPTYQADTASAAFDDQLIWLSRSSLVNRLVAVGKLP